MIVTCHDCYTVCRNSYYEVSHLEDYENNRAGERISGTAPFTRIGTVEPSDENEMDISGVRDEFVVKRRVRIFKNF